MRTGAEATTTIGAPAGGVVDAAPQAGPTRSGALPLFDIASMRPERHRGDRRRRREARVRVLFEAAPIGSSTRCCPQAAAHAAPRPDRLRAAPDADALEVELALTTQRGVRAPRRPRGVLALIGGMERWRPGYAVIDDHLGGGGRRLLVGEREGGAVAVGLAARRLADRHRHHPPPARQADRARAR
ncbi:MAG: hypothetical protein M5U28_05650 [Sandaracinaceae bacterium]|nr:hypothetical protein [Sandaracinaceae bacterium]